MKENNRIEWIDYLKAFACFLVVIGHLIQSLQKSNIDNYENITDFINWFIYLFHMPLFMCMSGFLYCKKRKEFTWDSYKKFEIKKIINLSIPYFVFYLIYVGINMIFSSSVNSAKGIDDILAMFNNPISPYWFLYALLSIFIVIPLLERLFKYDEKKVFFFLCILKCVNIFIKCPIFFINQIMSFGMYFYIGCFICKENKKADLKNIIKNIFFIVAYVIIAMFFYKIKTNVNIYVKEFLEILFAIFGIFICINTFKMINKNILLDTFKKYTFQIFVLHTIFAAGMRIILLKIGIRNYWIHFLIGMLSSIYIPVMISKISEKILYTNIAFFPLKTIEEIKERKIQNVRKET